MRVRPGGSRWAPGPAGYARTATYGRSEQDGGWLASVSGVAAADSSVFVFDQGRPAIVELSRMLRPIRAVGHAGRGRASSRRRHAGLTWGLVYSVVPTQTTADCHATPS